VTTSDGSQSREHVTSRATSLRLVTIALTVCLLAAACGTSGSSSSSNGSDSTSRAGRVSVADTEHALVGAGVRVFSDDGGATVAEPSAPESAMSVREGWMRSMADEAESGAGSRGADLDALGGGGPDGVPMSAVLAAYARGVDTEGAAFSKRLLDGQDLLHPDHVVFPAVVLALFAADASRAFGGAAGASGSPGDGSTETSAGAPAAPGQPVALGPDQLRLISGGICSDVTSTIFNTINKIFAAIQIPDIQLPKTGIAFLDGLLQGFTDMVVGGLNFVINAAKELVVGVAVYAIDKLLSVVARVATVAAMLANFTMAVGRWNLDAKAEDESTRKGVGAEQINVRVSVTATATTQSVTGDDWPEWFKDCAATAKVQLPSLRPVGAKITWSVLQEPADADLAFESAAVTAKDSVLQDVDRKAVGRIGLVTGTETQEQKQKGAEQHGVVRVTAQIRRTQIEELRATLRELAEGTASDALGFLPPQIKKYLVDIVGSAVNAATDGLAGLLLDNTVTKVIDVTYHGTPDEKQPVASAPQTTAGASDPCALISDAEAAVIVGTGIARNEPSTTGDLGYSCVKGNARVSDEITNAAFLSYSVFSIPVETFLAETSGEGKVVPTEVGGVGDRALMIADGGVLIVGSGGQTITVQIYKFGNVGSFDELAAVARTMLQRI
jgi:hypothetical protein